VRRNPMTELLYEDPAKTLEELTARINAIRDSL
jgi:hypothetical protein